MSCDGADLFSPARIDALFAPLEAAKSLLIAVSGGPNSTALLAMAAEWAAERGRRIAAATVDHGLRPESAAEAQAVAAMSAKLGAAHATLVWVAAKPSARLQERAREARYRLLIDHARTIGADAIATAHHADDQAETVLFRLMRGSGVAGLAGMDALTVREGITIARPLLGVAKCDLVAFCRSRGLAFIDDPSNADPRFARTRLRVLLARLNEEGLDAEGLTRLARRAAEADAALARFAAAVEARLGESGPIDAGALFAEPIAIIQRVLARRVAAAGGREENRIGLEKIEALALRLKAAAALGEKFNANVGGVLARLSASGELSFEPEPPRRPKADTGGAAANAPTTVMVVPGLDPRIVPATHAAQLPRRGKAMRSATRSKRLDKRNRVDGRDKPGHDG